MYLIGLTTICSSGLISRAIAVGHTCVGDGSLDVHLLGVRGSMPVCGEAFLKFGGNTSCLGFAHDDELPTLLLDAGTGLHGVPALMGGSPFQGAMLLTHLHWDHFQGLPFCSSLDRADAEVDLYLPAALGDALGVLRHVMAPPYFPIGPEQLRGRWSFGSLVEGWHDLAGFSVLAAEIPHGGGTTYGYRVTDGTGTVTFIPDHQPTMLGWGPDGLGEYHDPVRRLAGGAQVLIHDGQYSQRELPRVAQFGHSAARYGAELARRCAAERLLFVHHDPNRSDVLVEALEAEASVGLSEVSVAAGRQGSHWRTTARDSSEWSL